MPLAMALKEWLKDRHFQWKWKLRKTAFWNPVGTGHQLWVGVARKAVGWCGCLTEREGAAFHRVLLPASSVYMPVTVVGSLKSTSGLSHDETTDWLKCLSLYSGYLLEARKSGRNEDDGGNIFSSLKHWNSYLNCHLCLGPKVFIQNDNKKTP